MADANAITAEEIRVVLGASIPPETAQEIRRRVGAVLDHVRQPVLSARVRVDRHHDPAAPRPVTAQATVDVNGRLVRAQVDAATVGEALAALEEKLRHSAERVAARWKDRSSRRPSEGPHEWRHRDEPARRPSYYPRPPEERRVVRRKAFGLAVCTVDEAAFDMDLLDYDFHLFTELGSGQDSVLYRAGPTGYRLAQVAPEPDRVATGAAPLTISPLPATIATLAEAVERLNLSGRPFLFFRPPEAPGGESPESPGHARGRVLYRRYDGHYGLITPAA